MSDEVQQACADLAAWDTATVMIIRREETPAMLRAAVEHGDMHAQIRLGVVGKVVPQIEDGSQTCVLVPGKRCCLTQRQF